MIHSKYSGMIQCKKCGKNYKTKKERNVQKYICAGYDRYGKKFCERFLVTEKLLDELIQLHFRENIENSQIRNHVKKIEIDKENIVITYSDDTQTIRTKRFLKI